MVNLSNSHTFVNTKVKKLFLILVPRVLLGIIIPFERLGIVGWNRTKKLGLPFSIDLMEVKYNMADGRERGLIVDFTSRLCQVSLLN